MNDSSDRALNHLLITGGAFSRIERRKTHPSSHSSEPGRQQAGREALLPASISPGPSPWFYVPLSSASRFLALWLQDVGVPSYFQHGAGELGPPKARSPSQVYGGPMGYKKPFPAPKPGGGAREEPPAQPQAPGTGQETPNEAILRQNISCNSPDPESLLLPPSQGPGGRIWLQEKLPRARGSRNQGNRVTKGAEEHNTEKPTPTLLAARSRGSLRAAQPSQAKELPVQSLSTAKKKPQNHC